MRWWLVGLTAALLGAGCSTQGASNTGNTGTLSPVQSATVGAIKWLQSHKPALEALQTDLNKVTDSGNASNLPGVVTGCQNLKTDTTADLALAPIPDAQIQGHWSASLADFQSGATDCISGIQESDLGLEAQYKAQIASGISQSNTLVKEFNALVAQATTP